jgi:hypothetical protein
MAEWSMAVVLKTSRNRLCEDGYVFRPDFNPVFANSVRFYLTFLVFQLTVITDRSNFVHNSLI